MHRDKCAIDADVVLAFHHLIADSWLALAASHQLAGVSYFVTLGNNKDAQKTNIEPDSNPFD